MCTAISQYSDHSEHEHTELFYLELTKAVTSLQLW
jgi:hypothetical protein